MSNLLLINGKSMKNPSPNFKYLEQQLVTEARNANGVVTATKVGRRQMKLEGLIWRGLTREEWKEIREEIEDFYCDVTYFDIYKDEIITRRMYFGDTSADVLEWDRSGDIMIPKIYKECACNIIDVGESD